MARSASSFGRRAAQFKPQPLVLVICEDSKSGRQYLEDASRYLRADVKVEIAFCGHTDPKGIVEAALKRKSNFDVVFCAIDRDRHPSFDEALVLARTAPKVRVIASYPSFEFWFLLHFGFTRKPFVESGKYSPGDCVLNELRKCEGMDKYDKGKCEKIFETLGIERFNAARRVSPRVLSEAIKDGNMNPSTAVHELIEFIENLGKPQLA